MRKLTKSVRTLKLFFLLCFLLSNLGVWASEKPVPAVKTDTSSAMVALKLPAGKLIQYRQSKDFIYKTNEPATDSFWDMFFSRIRSLLETIIESKFSRITFIALCIGVFIALVLSFVGSDIRSVFSKNKMELDFIPVLEDGKVDELNFDAAVDNEIKQGNYNRAVRFLYLKLLQQLARKDLIIWQKEKVNHDYFREMFNSVYFADFKKITNTYEYVWYGKFPLERTEFDTINLSFAQFFKQIDA
jgi:hypothetical protein